MKKFIMGLIAGIAVATTASVYAEDTVEKVEAYLRPSLPVTLDGKEVKLDNAPVMYDGSTYLKLRDVAKITGMGVDWNQETQTVELKSAYVGTEESTTETTNATMKLDSGVEEITVQNNKGIVYNGVTYYNPFHFNTVRTKEIIRFDNALRTLTIKLKDGTEKVINVDSANPEDFVIYKGESYVNVKYYPE